MFMSGAMAGLKPLFLTMPSEECWEKSASVAARRAKGLWVTLYRRNM
jgi:hypothetical protein